MNIPHSRYAFLKDPEALEEIRKHKWLESEKKGEEVGFATAALDWINTYGRAWLSWKRRQERFANTFTFNSQL
ncbi:MAG: hypothetical protein A2Z88_04480 [Omnitrophica WOR_2 bacterium GWA2_47_8]|nr:MAG: hypothetical protein A2Z88_04480 [Omnitrophica WOR_2 bacterium GWA2_47_8]